MKFWQLLAIARDTDDLPLKVAQSRPEWADIAQWYLQNKKLAPRSSALDSELPAEYIAEVLSKLNTTCYLSEHKWLRSFRVLPGDVELTLLDAYRSYGGTALEEAFEKGTVAVCEAQEL